MPRRTKEELKAANYYEWLEVCKTLREKKKSGEKLLPAEKEVLRTVPSPEKPYAPLTAVAEKRQEKKKAAQKAAKITFNKDVVWPEKGGAFLCAVFNTPYTDEQCVLFCDRDDCPFHGVGYFKSHGKR